MKTFKIIKTFAIFLLAMGGFFSSSNTIFADSAPVLLGSPNYLLSETLADTETPTSTPTDTPTSTPTQTATSTSTDTPTNTPTNTPTQTATNTPTYTPTSTPTDTPTSTSTQTATNTPTDTPTNAPTSTPSYTLTQTPSYTPTNTPPNTPTQTPTSTPSPVVTYTFALCQGFNLISLPLANTGLNTADDLRGAICSGGGSADMIWGYNCNTRSFYSHGILDDPPGFSVAPGFALWANVPSAGGCTWNLSGIRPSGISYTLCKGLNLVSVPVYSTSIINASQLMASIPSCNGIYRYAREIDCSQMHFDLYGSLSPPEEDFPIIHGRTYWIMVSAAGTWTPPNP